MIEVSAYEAKTPLAELLRKVHAGGRVLITKHHVAVAVMAPVSPQRKKTLSETVKAMKVFREGNILRSLSIKKMI